MSEEQKKPFSVNIPEDDFVDDIPVPEDGTSSDGKPHKVVRYVDNSPKEEKAAKEKKKNSFVGEFLAGAAAGAKTVGEGISAGIKTVSEKKPAAEKKPKPEKAKPAAPKAEVVDETQFPKDEKPAKENPLSGIMDKLKNLPTKTVIIGAAAILVVLIALILLLATSCSPSDEPSGPNNPGSDIVIGEDNNNDDNPGQNPEEEQKIEIPSRKDQYVEAFNTNNDVIGWLYIPGLEDVDAGVCFSYDKSYPYNNAISPAKRSPTATGSTAHITPISATSSETLPQNFPPTP